MLLANAIDSTVFFSQCKWFCIIALFCFEKSRMLEISKYNFSSIDLDTARR